MPSKKEKEKKVSLAKIISSENFAKRIKIEDIETEEIDDGLLIKGVPVFKSGTHRGFKYDNKFIDEKLIKQFDKEEDIPLQADHSDSWESTLGYVKKVYRKGSIMYADLMLIADNAVARWSKGLMKKWSVSINKVTGKLHEISAVAFPYVKEAAVHGDVAEVGMKDYEVEENSKGKTPPKVEVEEIEARELIPEKAPENINHNEDEEELIQWSDKTSVSIQSDGTPDGTSIVVNGKTIKNLDEISFGLYFDRVRLLYATKVDDKDGFTKRTSYELRNTAIYEDGVYAEQPLFSGNPAAANLSSWSQDFINDLPDSSFALVKHSVDNKVEGRALPYKDADDTIDPAHVRKALAELSEIEGFSEDAMSEAKTILFDAAEKVGIKVEEKTENKMADETKTKATPEESVLLKEALEKEHELTDTLKDKDAKVSELSESIKAKDAQIAEYEVGQKLNELKTDGKILPAQEEQLKAFMLTLDKEKRDEFAKILGEGDKKVDLGEASTQTSEKTDAAKFNLDEMSADEIEAEIGKYAVAEGIPESDARDIFYEKYSVKE